DQKLVFIRSWEDAKQRVAGASRLLQDLAKIAREAKPDAAPAAMPPPSSELVKRTALAGAGQGKRRA
ncbi:MAG TPA: hypothetical protein VGD08_11575, partial [Stellaceae bacterium]